MNKSTIFRSTFNLHTFQSGFKMIFVGSDRM